MSGFSEAKEDVEVERHDQERICEFGRNANHLSEFDDERKALRAEAETLEDAEQEMMLADDSDGVSRLHIGEAFFHVSEDYLTDYLDKKREENSRKLEHIEKEIVALNTRQGELKELLYAKFKNNINLEQ